MLRVINGITLLCGKYSWPLLFCQNGVKRVESLSIRRPEEPPGVDVWGLLFGLGAFQWRGINSYFEHAILQQSQRQH
jgi:hypothetical protein